MENLSEVFVGVDVSKEYLDIHVFPKEKVMRINNDKRGHQKFLKELKPHNVKRVVCESSGGYEEPFIQVLSNAGYEARIVDPKRIKAFAFSEGVKAKTDQIDAKMIARFASKTTFAYQPLMRSKEEKTLRALVDRRSVLVQRISEEKCRLQQAQEVLVQRSIKKSIKDTQKDIATIDKNIYLITSSNEAINKKIEILESVPCVGRVTAVTLVAEMPELGTLDRREIAALSGTAPFTKQSGSSTGHARTLPSRASVRKALHMAATVAMRHNATLKATYEKHRAAGKKPMVALTALARKLIVMLNAMIRDGKKWEERAVPV